MFSFKKVSYLKIYKCVQFFKVLFGNTKMFSFERYFKLKTLKVVLFWIMLVLRLFFTFKLCVLNKDNNLYLYLFIKH